MADTDKLRPYRRGNPPVLADDGRYVPEELTRIEKTLDQIVTILKSLEARIAALEA